MADSSVFRLQSKHDKHELQSQLLIPKVSSFIFLAYLDTMMSIFAFTSDVAVENPRAKKMCREPEDGRVVYNDDEWHIFLIFPIVDF